MKNAKKDIDKAHVFELNDNLQRLLHPLAKDWKHWILTRRNVEEVALQLAAYQMVAGSYADEVDQGGAGLRDSLQLD